jgi:hypothetical protein
LITELSTRHATGMTIYYEEKNMSRENIIKHTLRLNMDNKQHAFIHGVIAELNSNSFKSRNSFIVDALDFYIENAGNDIDACIALAHSYDKFVDLLKEKGYRIAKLIVCGRDGIFSTIVACKWKKC